MVVTEPTCQARRLWSAGGFRVDDGPRPIHVRSEEVGIPIPFSVFPSSYRNVSKDAVKEIQKLEVEAEAKQPQAGREGHSEHKESFSAHIKPAERRETYTEDVRVFEDRRRPQQEIREEIHIREEHRDQQRPQPQQQHQHQHREEVRVHEEHHFKQPEQPRREQVRIHEEHHFKEAEPRFRQPDTRFESERVEIHDRYQPSHHQDRTYDRDFKTVQGSSVDVGTTQIDVSERQYREHTRPIVGAAAAVNLSTSPNYEQASGYRKESFTAKHDTYPYRRDVDSVDTQYPPQARKRDMGYYDEDGHYHSFRHGISKAAHKVAEKVVHPYHSSHHHHSDHKSFVGSKHDDRREEVVVKERYTAAPAAPAPVPAPVRSHTTVTHHTHAAPAAPSSVSTIRSVQTAARPRTMAPNTITIPCHHIRIGDLLILQGRPCQVIRITTSSQTGQHRYLGVDLFTKQLHEESSFISNPAPSVVVQNMLGPVFKQYRVLDIREDGRVVAMTETGDVKQGLPVLDQSNLLKRLTDSFDNGRGSIRILVINDDGLEMAVDYKVVHGSRL
ncbi:hypothetical protein DM02DRAFT_671185 [Periconia macrospinosa]|uniref:Translation initiation factor 5A-like N-terminal domain-containing protein n=1 Tax=Periconia macrospinosa TaxID=97972 RepID=A0A2V1DTZ2_9PLEO|nr:hypothetical protein DM02DRAFT_671185 [Periconia macrospinosa]